MEPDSSAELERAAGDRTLDDLLAEAKRRKTDHLAGAFEAEAHKRYSGSYAERVAKAQADTAKLWEAGGQPVAFQRARARALLAPSATDEQVETLAKRRTFVAAVNTSLMQTFGDCRDAALSGPGLETIRTHGQPVIVVWAHTAPAFAVWYGIASAHGRTLYGPGDVPAPGTDEARRLIENREPMGLLYHLVESYGVRWVGADRRFDVYRRLLREGSPVGMAADHPGRQRGTVFGCPVRTSNGHVILARATGVPIVVVTGHLDEEGYGVTFSAPLDPGAFPSDDQMHDAVLQTVETQLGHDPAGLIQPFPAATPQERRRRQAIVTSADERARRAREAADAAQARLKPLRDALAEEAGRMADARAQADTALVALKAAQAAGDREAIDGARERHRLAREQVLIAGEARAAAQRAVQEAREPADSASAQWTAAVAHRRAVMLADAAGEQLADE